jgi:D-alanyl-lipoteichoic acid acyltransferase DltB (MBOAT superfamily)
MLFDTPLYLLFLILAVAVYWRLAFHAQNRFLLAASYFFYGWWDWRFLLLMIGSTVVDYVIAKRIADTEDRTRKRVLLVASLVLNFSILGFFKYCNFFVDSFAHLAHAFGLNVPTHILQIILPPGISFYTFQEVAYIVDVYKGKLPPARSFVQYGLFISLFPHLIAGPIQRPTHLLPQVQKPRTLDWQNVFDGIMLILEGLFRKCVIADNCALIANAAFSGRLGPASIPVTMLGVYAFAWQIYGDFSGYSSIARGSAQLLGFHFMVNFRQPYFAASLRDFWRRWHISLSTWLRDYLYIPLGGNQHGKWRTYRNLATTMLLGGLWHGANWTYVAWGGIHGAGLAAERAFGNVDETPASKTMFAVWIKRIAIFHLVCFAWLFFRADSFTRAFEMLAGLRVWDWNDSYWVAAKFVLIFSAPLLLLDLWLEKTGDEYAFQSSTVRRKLAFAATTVLIMALYGANRANAFIYFQF